MSVAQPSQSLLVHAVLDRDDRVAGGEVGPVVGQLGGGQRAALVLEHVAAVLVDLAGRPGRARSRRPRRACSRPPRCRPSAPRAPPRWRRGRARSRPRRRRRCRGRGRAASSSGGGRSRRPSAAHSRERSRTPRHDHELLEVDLVVGVRAAVEHVHHRHRQDVRRVAAEVAPQRLALLRRRRVRGGQRHGEDRVGAEARLARRAVELDQQAVDRRPGWSRPARAPPSRSRR